MAKTVLSIGRRLNLAGAWLVCAWAVAITAAWPNPYPQSAAGDLSWIYPSVGAIVALCWSTHVLLLSASLWGSLPSRAKISTVMPFVLALATSIVVYFRA
jgi:hypothetical protein